MAAEQSAGNEAAPPSGEVRKAGVSAAGMGVLFGAILLLASFGVPWWSISVAPDKKALRSNSADTEKRVKHLIKHVGWYVTYSNIINIDDFNDVEDIDDLTSGKRTWTGRVWGWHCGVGITTLILGVMTLVLMGMMLAFRLLRGWLWIGLFLAGLLGIPVFIMSLVWLITCPGDNVASLLTQGVHVGPFLAMTGGICVLLCGLAGGIMGLSRFTAAARAR